jgi:outer membrane protein TolC
LRYQEGKAPQVEVEQAAADLVEALAGRAEANAFRRIAWANLMRAVGIQNDQEDQKSYD